jgi:hypothetical protein
MKKSAKVLRNPYSAPIWETPNRPTNTKCIVAGFFGVWFVDKYGGLRTHNPSAEEVRGLGVFFV